MTVRLSSDDDRNDCLGSGVARSAPSLPASSQSADEFYLSTEVRQMSDEICSAAAPSDNLWSVPQIPGKSPRTASVSEKKPRRADRCAEITIFACQSPK